MMPNNNNAMHTASSTPLNSATNKTLTLYVPDIGDFKNVDIIEVCVKVGEVIAKDQTILILESDKASIEVPAEYAGVVQAVLVNPGEQVSQGSAIIEITAVDALPLNTVNSNTSNISNISNTIESSLESSSDHTAKNATVQQTSESESTSATNQTYDYDVVVIGAGPGGYSAAFRSADLGLKVAIVERHATLGGVCLNVGCIPSKALLHTVEVLEKAQSLAQHGIQFSTPTIDLDTVRQHKQHTVQQLTQGLKMMANMRKVDVITGEAHFIDAHHLQITSTAEVPSTQTTQTTQAISFKNAILATGSHAIALPFLPKDARIINSTGALELPFMPKRMLIIGGGIIGLEMATVYSGLGQQVGIAIDVVEMQGKLMAGADIDLVKIWEKRNQSRSPKRFANIMLHTKTIAAVASAAGIDVTFETSAIAGTAGQAEAKTFSKQYDLVLVAVGRKPNTTNLGLDKLNIAVNQQGFIAVDAQQRTSVEHVFAIGDIVGQPMLAHKAVHEGHVAAEVIAGHKTYFDAKVIPSVAYTHPEVAWVGETEESCAAKQIAFKKAVFPWSASGRAIANQTQDGLTKLLFDAETKRVIGGGIVGDHAGDLIAEVALAIEMGCDAVDIGKTIHPHPTLSESIGMAAEVSKQSCTDLPPQKA